MAFNFTLPFTKKRADVEHEAMQETPAAASPKRDSNSAPLKHGRKLPLIGGFPALRQIQILGAVIFLLFVFQKRFDMGVKKLDIFLIDIKVQFMASKIFVFS